MKHNHPPLDTPALLAAGRTLAGLARPGRDLSEFAHDFAEIGMTLKGIGAGLDTALDRAEETYDRIIAERDNYSAARLARDGEAEHARATALRTARQALVDLARVIAEIEAQIAAGESAV